MADFTDKLEPAKPTGPFTLTDERSRSSLPVKELASHLLSSDGFLERQERILRDLRGEKLLSKGSQLNLSRPDRYKLGLARAKLLRRMTDRLRWDGKDHQMATYLVDDTSPYQLHMSMFITTIREQGTDEQRAFWLPKIESWEIIGAYAQTELGHGSNVRGIELQARWNPMTKEFLLHSPTLTASKWWNGSLGRTANHAVVIAQLMLPERSSATISVNTKYKSYGPHPFIVQIRHMKTHEPLSGIAVGDIGPKYGYASMDNAYMLFNYFHIPHSALLSRYVHVDPNTSAYTKPSNPAVVYGSLTYVRSTMVMHARLVLARAVTVAVRYLAIRRQFQNRDGEGSGPEEQVLNYPTVQIRIFPLLATVFALHYAGQAMGALYLSTRAGITKGDFTNLADLHSTSSGLKSLCTTLAADGIETCRRAMGGHGYGGGSGLIQLNNDYLSKPTVEGDNWMITQQTAAHIIKRVAAALKTPDFEVTDRFDASLKLVLKARQSTDQNFPKYDILNVDDAIVDAFWHRAASLSLKAHEERIVKKRSWNSLLIQLYKLSNAHCFAILVSNFQAAITSDVTIPSGAWPVLRDLFRLFSLYHIDNSAREFHVSGAVSSDQLDKLPEAIQSIMERVRLHAVSLVDAWKVPDYLLDSALGRYDGKCYEELFYRAHKQNPLNEVTFNPRYWEEEIVMGSGVGWVGDDTLDIKAKL